METPLYRKRHGPSSVSGEEMGEMHWPVSRNQTELLSKGLDSFPGLWGSTGRG